MPQSPAASSRRPLVDMIAGARPNFMKIAPIIRAIQARQQQGSALAYRLVHTGQHYDSRMSSDFFAQLGIPEPDVNLEVGSGTQAEQAAGIMTRYELLLLDAPSDLCLVVGDVTSTMACAIAAQKLRVPVAHVEAGIRSGDWTMPEEINRVVTDSITNFFFTTSEVANANLRATVASASSATQPGCTLQRARGGGPLRAGRPHRRRALRDPHARHRRVRRRRRCLPLAWTAPRRCWWPRWRPSARARRR